LLRCLQLLSALDPTENQFITGFSFCTGMLSESAEAGDFRSVGIGVRGIRQLLSGGRLEIDSCSQGTAVTAFVPIAKEERYDSHPAR
jgi:signal transduction histidine kinase